MAQFCYRTSFLAAATTYGIVVYKTQRARAKTGTKPPLGVVGYLSDENVQYLRTSWLVCFPTLGKITDQIFRCLVLALVWLISPQYPLALLPYSVYSIFHIATYTRANLIPTISPPPADSPKKEEGPIAQKIGYFVKEHYTASMSIVSSLEILLWARLLLSAIFFQRRSWILIALYTAFLRARFALSPHVRGSISQLGARVDSLVGAQGTPPAVRQIWEGVKSFSKQFHDATDAGKYLQTGSAAKKTS